MEKEPEVRGSKPEPERQFSQRGASLRLLISGFGLLSAFEFRISELSHPTGKILLAFFPRGTIKVLFFEIANQVFAFIAIKCPGTP